jgi:1-acyl-sn-glycerol-3-phosphate acyltransferase
MPGMIKAVHRQWAKIIFHTYAMKAIRRDFDSVYLTAPFPQIPEDKALILAPTHISWWDGFFSFFLCKKFCGKKYHIMMLERQLKRFFYFRHVGAYSVVPGNKTDVREVFDYTQNLLADPRNLVTIFPEGEIICQEQSRPIQSGGIIHHLAKKDSAGFLVLPLAYRMHFREARNPELWIAPGALLSPESIRGNKTLLSTILSDLSQSLLLACLERKGINVPV